MYNLLRELADSWGLVAMLFFWAAFVGWAFLPRNRTRNEDAANIIFKDADHG
jgi:cytochrome c oxidase cbb3-type subunit 4